MTYVPTHPKPFKSLTTFPTTVAGFNRRICALTKEIDHHSDGKRRAVLKVVRSITFIQAEEALGEVRFRQLCREIGLSMRSPKLTWHRLIAEHAGYLLRIADVLPDDDAALARLAKSNVNSPKIKR
jgi:hypothetical protein